MKVIKYINGLEKVTLYLKFKMMLGHHLISRFFLSLFLFYFWPKFFRQLLKYSILFFRASNHTSEMYMFVYAWLCIYNVAMQNNGRSFKHLRNVTFPRHYPLPFLQRTRFPRILSCFKEEIQYERWTKVCSVRFFWARWLQAFMCVTFAV